MGGTIVDDLTKRRRSIFTQSVRSGGFSDYVGGAYWLSGTRRFFKHVCAMKDACWASEVSDAVARTV